MERLEMNEEQMGKFIREASNGGEWSFELKRYRSLHFVARAIRWPADGSLDVLEARAVDMWAALEALAAKMEAQ